VITAVGRSRPGGVAPPLGPGRRGLGGAMRRGSGPVGVGSGVKVANRSSSCVGGGAATPRPSAPASKSASSQSPARSRQRGDGAKPDHASRSASADSGSSTSTFGTSPVGGSAQWGMLGGTIGFGRGTPPTPSGGSGE